MSREGGGQRALCPLTLSPRAPSSQRGARGLCSRDSSQGLELWPRCRPLCSWRKEFCSEWLPCTDPCTVRACDTVISFFLSKKGQGVGWLADPKATGDLPAWLAALLGVPGTVSGRGNEGLFLSLPLLVNAFPQTIGASASLQKATALGSKTHGQMPPVCERDRGDLGAEVAVT